ncbi:taste receptor type 2 member 8-like [Heteronotia binoei]|uniref:taste receptor type 2 member 8-like n=1 Tax=Heteronotia binoei TaxID=13085 RepID=UPI00292E5756|nr:taste receptor type 2 member 8-like [Heteronotia binoei]
MVANGSIVLINFVDWFRRGKLSSTDLILISLGFSRLLHLAVVILEVNAFILQKNKLNYIVVMLIGIWTFMNTVNLWFSACLSVFYLAKIAIFSHPLFLQVKQRFSGLVPWLLLGSVVLSVVVAIIVLTSWSYGLSTCNPYISHSSNGSSEEMNMPHVCMRIIALIATFDFVPFLVFLSSSLLLICSLWKHMRRVRCNGTGTRDLNTQAHLSAIKALASSGVLHLISFIALTSESVLSWSNRDTGVIVLFNVSAVYPSGHGIILILMNPKLKQAWVRMVHLLKCRLNKVPS